MDLEDPGIDEDEFLDDEFNLTEFDSTNENDGSNSSPMLVEKMNEEVKA
jgi:hypothetical protein